MVDSEGFMQNERTSAQLNTCARGPGLGRGPGPGPARPGIGGLDNWGSPELGLARQTGRSLDLNMAFGMDFDDFRWVFIGN